MKNLIILLILLSVSSISAQDSKLPFYELPEHPQKYTAGTVAARQVEALGFRFYHATENLSVADLKYKPNEEARTTLETIQHIYDLSKIVLNATLYSPNKNEEVNLSYLDLREQTLSNLKKASEVLRETEDLSTMFIIFGDNKIPFWNAINGPISDAIWHCGQISSNRRSSENPINPKVNHFMGTVRK
ncbi:hypothetical protein [Aurantibacter aestuarii]|uniref:DinB family protein n=1 Tax=Aurantibacter aestuarii TaxID=1266046 RepID=A0A2T1N515_9FLAO|nr:hypothetical protein [Aurantibacter aestuarii]PSG86320.1 hypothetical protein C7H52_11540 [Aurantibacter aestuarii]